MLRLCKQSWQRPARSLWTLFAIWSIGVSLFAFPKGQKPIFLFKVLLFNNKLYTERKGKYMKSDWCSSYYRNFLHIMAQVDSWVEHVEWRCQSQFESVLPLPPPSSYNFKLLHFYSLQYNTKGAETAHMASVCLFIPGINRFHNPLRRCKYSACHSIGIRDYCKHVCNVRKRSKYNT